MTDRRNFITGSAVAAASLTIPGKAIAADADAGILEAWERWVAARTAINVLPVSYDEWDTREENRLWQLVDKAEEDIRRAKAATKDGAAIQLWIALAHSLETLRQDELIATRNLAAFEQDDPDFDWNVRLLLAALRSLEA
ncbi:hypothetical protein GCM10023208_08170 [Erythrobacter westpacificensis]|uniref:Twin-arginine translocation signal domain-containing protein n=1 Tax=Erythrobacter westpacificensis TaxID=1055231 RepID=A0ABP9K499_9SPHN